MSVVSRAALVVLSFVSLAGGAAANCADPDGGIGVSRIVEIDTTAGPLYGDMSRYVREDSFLGPKEVVLTFDDGPMPAVTRSILDTLDKFCTKATFFSVGRMAIAYPSVVKEVMARGHTMGTHTWSHPFHLKSSGIARARDEIERGFAAVAMAAGQPIAPFFRFPGLSDSDPMLGYLQSRGIAAFTVDVVSNDSYIGDANRLTERTIAHTVARNGGILLFHDIKSSAARALPEILRQLKQRGFTVVHMRAKAPYAPVPDYDVTLSAAMAKTAQPQAKGGKPTLIPFTAAATAMPSVTTVAEEVETAAMAPPQEASTPEAPVTVLTPPVRLRTQGPVAKSTVREGDGSANGERQKQRLATTDDETAPPAKPRTPHVRHKKHRLPPVDTGEPKRFFD